MSTTRKNKLPTTSKELDKRTKKEWIEGAVALKHERFEVAGALFNCNPDELLSQQEVEKRLGAYLNPTATQKEEVNNVNSEG